jgi:mannan endo-1,4-beta-mannosidase
VSRIPPRWRLRVWLVAACATALATLGATSLVPVQTNAGSQPRFGVASGPHEPVFAAHRGLLTAVGALRSAAAQAEVGLPPGIVRTVGTHLVVDGQPWRFLGFNDYKLTSQTYAAGFTCGGEHPDAAVAADFAAMHRLGVTVVRTWFFQSFVAGRTWAAFDRVLADAAQNGIRVIPVLSTQWGDCENFNHAPLAYKSLAWYQSDYLTHADYGMALPYHDYAVMVAHHYAGDPRIAFWQLMNEAEAADSQGGRCHEQNAAKTLRAFADNMTAAVKSADPSHLVSLGTSGGNQCGTAGADYTYINGGSIDICEYHDYATTPVSAPRVNPCSGLQKPLFVGERGFKADLGTGAVTPETLQQRARYFATEIQSSLGSDAFQGYLLWSWSIGPSVSYDVSPSDPTAAVLVNAMPLATPEAVYLAVAHSG